MGGSLTYAITCNYLPADSDCIYSQTNISGSYTYTTSNPGDNTRLDPAYTETITGSASSTNWTVIFTLDGTISVTNYYGAGDCESDGLSYYNDDGYALPLANWDSTWDEVAPVDTQTQTQDVFTVNVDVEDEDSTTHDALKNTTQLSSEDPTSRLLQPVTMDDTDWQDGVGGASLSVSGDQSQVSMTGSRVQFLINVPAGQEFQIPYVVNCQMDPMILDANTVVAGTNVSYTNVIAGKGYGFPMYYPSGQGLMLCPPYGQMDNGCSTIYGGGSASLQILGWITFDDGTDSGCGHSLSCPSCNNSPGMPRWWVTEPYINLWAADKPVEYVTSLGEKLGFQVTYKQRDDRPALINGQKPFFPVNGWNNNWYSYVHFTGSNNNFATWGATVYQPGGGVENFQPGGAADPNSGDILLPLDGVDGHESSLGFRLVHSDGSQQIYSLVTAPYPQVYQDNVPIMQDQAGATNLSWVPRERDYR